MCDYEEETIATTRGSKNGIGTEAKKRLPNQLTFAPLIT